jgi:lipopolysaccharide transport system ATP-binding protein
MSTVIEVDDVWKKYRLGVLGTGTLRHDLDRWWHRIRGKPDPHAKVDQEAEVESPKLKGEGPNGGSGGDLSDDEMWALRGVSFDVKQGEILGIIGRNGAGKSTLLKILSRVTLPTKGEVRIKGRIASLLEVGTGFHPELTGRENTFLNGAILGMSRSEIKMKFDEIVTFAGIDTYIDTPVKRYSSGMYVRLAFAVAAHLESEILIVDEVLAVGDAEFQKKCLGKMRQVSREGRTVFFVSHNTNAIIALCTEAMVLKEGLVAFKGNIRTALTHYGAATEVSDVVEFSSQNSGSNLKRMRLTGASGGVLNPLDDITFDVELNATRLLKQPRLAVAFTNIKGERVFAVGSWLGPDRLPPLEGPRIVRITFTMPPLVPGRYTLDVALYDSEANTREDYFAAGAVEVSETNYLRMLEPFQAEIGQLYVRSKFDVL